MYRNQWPDTNGMGGRMLPELVAEWFRNTQIISVEQIDNLLADREFIGHDWFEWLRQKKILCRLRIRGDITVEHKNKKVRADVTGHLRTYVKPADF